MSDPQDIFTVVEMGVVGVAVEHIPIHVAVAETGTFISSLGSGEEREFAWVTVDAMTSVETIELAAESFDSGNPIRATFEAFSSLESESDKYVLQHWGHPMVQCLVARKPHIDDRVIKALAFRLCVRCESDLFQALTTNDTMAIAGNMSCEYDADDDKTWPRFVSVRTKLNQIQQAELAAWRMAYKIRADEGEQLSIYSVDD